MKTIAKKTKKDVQPRPKFSVMAVILLIGLIVYTICLLSPLLYGLVTSLKTNEDYTLNPTGFPNPLSFSNYATAFEGFYVTIYNAAGMRNIYLERMMLNSLLYALGCSFMSVAVPCLAAYVVANYKYKICNVIYVFVIISIILPIVGSLPSELQLARALGLYDNFFGLWIMSGHIRSMYFLILHATFKAFPKDYAEAAKIDGASGWKSLWHITIPNVMPSITICTFLSLTNGFKLYDQNLALTGGEPYVQLADGNVIKTTEMLALNIVSSNTSNTKGPGQAKAVVFFILVGIIGIAQLIATRKKEVQQ